VWNFYKLILVMILGTIALIPIVCLILIALSFL